MLRIDTPRLALREFRPDDLDDLLSMDGDPRVMRYLANGLPARSREECETALARMVRFVAWRAQA